MIYRTIALTMLIFSSCQNAQQKNNPEQTAPRAPTESEIEDYLKEKEEKLILEKENEGNLNKRIFELEREINVLKAQNEAWERKMSRDDSRLFKRIPEDTINIWTSRIIDNERSIGNLSIELNRLYEIRGHKESPQVKF